MNEIQLSGLASGFDFRPVIDQLISLERVPQNRLRVEKSELQNKSSIYDSLKTRLEDLQTSLESLDDTDLFFGRNVSLAGGNDSSFSATSDQKTILGNYEFNVTNLATSTIASGSTDVGAAITDTSTTLENLNLSTAVTDGTITINGAQISVDRTQTLQSLFDDILTQTTAAGDAVTASYDSGTDTITLSAASGSTILGSSADTSNFFTATKLTSNALGDAESSSALGGVNFSASLDGGFTGLNNPITTDGSFSINGVEISIDASEDTMLDLISRVNESDAQVTLAYDATNDQFTIQNNNTGSTGMDLDENGSGFFTAIGIDTANINYTLGENAEFSVNGGATLVSTSNTFDADVHGITGLSVTATELGAETVSVTSSATDGRAKIDDFISKYNSVQSYLETQTKITVNDGDVTTGTLSGNTDMTQLISKLRQAAFGTVTSLAGGDVKRLADMGIDFKSDSNELEVVDSTALDDALKDNSSAITTLFTDSTEGLVASLDQLIEVYTKNDGTIDILNDSIDDQVDTIDNQIGVLERLIQQKENSLEASFLAMEQAQAEINRQAQILNSTF